MKINRYQLRKLIMEALNQPDTFDNTTHMSNEDSGMDRDVLAVLTNGSLVIRTNASGLYYLNDIARSYNEDMVAARLPEGERSSIESETVSAGAFQPEHIVIVHRDYSSDVHSLMANSYFYADSKPDGPGGSAEMAHVSDMSDVENKGIDNAYMYTLLSDYEA